MMTAMLTVENILAGSRLYDTWCVNEDANIMKRATRGPRKPCRKRAKHRLTNR